VAVSVKTSALLLCRRVVPGARPVLPTATPPLPMQDSDQSMDSQITGGRAAFAHEQRVLDRSILAKTSMKSKLTDEERLARLLKEKEREKKRRLKEERKEARRKLEQERDERRAEKERDKKAKEEARMRRLKEKEAREEKRRKEKKDKEEAKAAKEEAAKAAREAEKEQRKKEKREEAKERKEAAKAAREEAAKLPRDAQEKQRKKEEERQNLGETEGLQSTSGGPVKGRKGKTKGVRSRKEAGGKGGPGKGRAKGGRGKSVATRSGGLKDGKKKTTKEAEEVEEREREGGAAKGAAKNDRRGPGRKAAMRGAGKHSEEETGAKNAEPETDEGEAREKRETRKRVGAHEDGESGPAKRTRRSKTGGAEVEEGTARGMVDKERGAEVGDRQMRKRRREEAGLVQKESDKGEVALLEKGEERMGKKSVKKARASKSGDDGEQGSMRGDEASQVEEKRDEPSRKKKEGGRKGRGRREVEHETGADNSLKAGEEGVDGGRRRRGGARVRVEKGGGNGEGSGQGQAAHKYNGMGQRSSIMTRKRGRQEGTDEGREQDVFEVENAKAGVEVRRSRRLSKMGVEKGEGIAAQDKSALSESEEDGPAETAADRTPARSPEKRTRAKKTPAEGAADVQITLRDATKSAEVEVGDELGTAGSPLLRLSPRRGPRASGLGKGNGKDGVPAIGERTAEGRGARRAGKEERQRMKGHTRGHPEDPVQEDYILSRQRKQPGRGGRVAGGMSPVEKKQGTSEEVLVEKHPDETSQAALRRSARSSKRQPR
jgi:hypothetical protein